MTVPSDASEEGAKSEEGRITLDTEADTQMTPHEHAPLSSSSGEDEDQRSTQSSLFRRRPYVSRHRRELDRISRDSTSNLRYPVPYHDRESMRNNSRNVVVGDEPSSRCQRIVSHCQAAMNRKTCNDWLETFLPMWRWLPSYKWKSTFSKDLIAGLTVGVMIVPQSMSYAKLAGLPVEYGLYSALMPVYAYAVFGSSRQLAVGPVALISLLLSTGLTTILEQEGIATDDSQYMTIYTTLAVQTAFLVGVINIGLGLVRLGFVTIFLSHAVISGFTSGAAVIIGLSQVKYIFGYDIERSDRIYEILASLFENIDQFNWKTFLMGTFSIIALLYLKHIGKKYPKFKWVRAIGPLAVTAVTIILVVAFDLYEKGIPIVGTIPKGLPSFTADLWTSIPYVDKMLLMVFSIVIVGFMESIAIAKQLASKHRYEIDSSQELIGLGMANLVGSMFQSYPVTGSFSRSAVNNESGAESGISGTVTATLVGFTLLFLTPVFEKMPLCVLAAIVISGVIGLFDYEEATYLWKVHKFDFSVWIVACLGTMFLGVEIGLAIAVAVSLLIVIYESAYPHTAVLGRLPGTSVYRNIKQYPEAEQYDGLVIVRIDAPLYFANAQNVRDKVRKYRLRAADELAERNGDVKYVILEMSPVSHIDTSALHLLDDMYVTYKARGQQLCFSNPSLGVMDRMLKSGFVDQVGREHFFSSVADAVHWCLNEMDGEAISLHESVHGRESSDSQEATNEEEQPAADIEAPVATESSPSE